MKNEYYHKLHDLNLHILALENINADLLDALKLLAKSAPEFTKGQSEARRAIARAEVGNAKSILNL